MHRSVEITASTSAMSRRRSPSINTSRTLLGMSAWSAVRRPDAYRPTAIPVIVGSRISGKALFVPVDSPAIGTLPHSRTTARCVPSPPRTTIASTPASRIRRAARKVSSTVERTSMSRNSTWGKRGLMRPSRSRLRDSIALMPPLSGITSTLSTPQLPADASRRSRMLTRSAICRLFAWAITRRMSRAETGLAMIPMQDAPAPKPDLLTLAGPATHPDDWSTTASVTRRYFTPKRGARGRAPPGRPTSHRGRPAERAGLEAGDRIAMLECPRPRERTTVHRTPFKNLVPPPPTLRLTEQRVALLVVDFQAFASDRSAGLGRLAAERGLEEELEGYYE